MPENINTSMTFIRHGPKSQDGRLTEYGVKDAECFGEKVFTDLLESPPGTIACIWPSNVARNIETAVAIERILISNAANNENIVVLEAGRLNKKEMQQAAKDLGSQKMLVTNLFPQLAIGFKENGPDPIGDETVRLKNILGGNEETLNDTIGAIWASTPPETTFIRSMISQRYPNINLSELDPDPIKFGLNPEDETKRQIRWMRAVLQAVENYFPNNPVKIVAITNTISVDFAVMSLLGIPITAANFLELGGARRYLEPHNVNVIRDGDGKTNISVSFRGKKRQFDGDELDQLLLKLQASSAKRNQARVEQMNKTT